MRNRILVTFLFALLVCAVSLSPCTATYARGPSTAEERAQALKLVQLLETQPLDPPAKEARQWLTMWLIEVPDINIKLCTGVLSGFQKRTDNYSAEIFTQKMFSQAAFIIKNPDKANDTFACEKAGVEGALNAYQAILKEKPSARWQFLDDLLQKRDKGELDKEIKESLKKCK